MEGIITAYYIAEQEREIPFYLDLPQAIEEFRLFTRHPSKKRSDNNQIWVLSSRGGNQSSLCISYFATNRWCVTANAVNRRRLFGLFLPRQTMQTLQNLDQSETEHWIIHFFEDTLEQFTTRLQALVQC